MSNLKRILVAALFGLSNFSTLLLAQHPPAGLAYDGWQSAPGKIPSNNNSLEQIPPVQTATIATPTMAAPTSRVEQTAYYQAQGSLSDRLPPAGSLPPAASASMDLPPGMGVSQAFPALPQSTQDSGLNNAVPGGGYNYPTSPPILPQSPDLGSSASAPPQRLPRQIPDSQSPGSAQPLASYGQLPSGSTPARPSSNQPVMPAAPTFNSGYQANGQIPGGLEAPSQQPRSAMTKAGQTVAYQQQPQSRGGTASRLREIDGGAILPNGRLDPNTIATGAPYVTPPPQGRYPTSPYNQAFFQTVAYQRNAASSPPNYSAPTMQLANTQLPNAQAVPPGTGIYPTAYQCQPAPTLPPGTAATYVPGTVTPDLAPTVYSGKNAGLRPLFSLGQENYNVQLGRGIIGQPTVYVPRQPIRNFFRYIFP